ncbi:MAG: GNAT family N-acetyltransferase [Treponema sp.]|jgi:ribosomal protein S18 acetylase RimI-like enzyme|nr:GNAT family N-acetyltransferase [Treponema sp.]
MQFELTEALIDDILFSMEDQNGEFLFDTHNGAVINETEEGYEETEEEGRLISLPKWDSSEGYHLMEKFAATFKNAIVREKLTAALSRGKGVFRAFKDALGAYPEAEQLWFCFKEREMRREILDWYNGLREEWGLERIGGEPEETADLILEDFRFRVPQKGDTQAAAELHQRCLEELIESTGKKGLGQRAAFINDWVKGLEIKAITAPVLIVETGAGEFAGYAATELQKDILYITALEVKPEYRGLGIGETLLTKLLEGKEARGATHIAAELPLGTLAAADGFSRVLHRNFFVPFSTFYVLKNNPPFK